MVNSHPTTARLFLGTMLDPQERQLVEALRSPLILELLTENHVVKTIKPEKLHLTWLFLGSVPVTEIEKISSVVDQVVKTTTQFDINLNHIELWPNNEKARTLVLTTSKASEKAIALAQTIKSKLSDDIIGAKDYAFCPHITLARLEKPRQSCKINQAFDGLFRLKIPEISLIHSHIEKPGGPYEAVSCWHLPN
jgi:2'-5' RNA ligase